MLETTRALYQTDTDFIYRFKRCIGVNDIHLATTRADFLDRSIVIKLKRIYEHERIKKEDIDREFDELKSFILGYVLWKTILKINWCHHNS